MALPSSGALSMRDIADELGINPNTSLTLAGMSGTAGFSDPDSMSEFYGYSSVTGAFEAGFSLYSPFSACNITTGSYVTYYHDGDNANPLVNDKIYTNEAQTTTAPNGYYALVGGAYVRVFGGTGNVISIGAC